MPPAVTSRSRAVTLALLLALATSLSLAAPPPTSGAQTSGAQPSPLGLTCAPIPDGVRHCPGDGDLRRVPSFDGVPIDVDVTLPPTGAGPWPTIVMINGLGGDKAQLQRNVDPPPSDTPPPLPPNTTMYDNVHFASRGYAVVNIATRGFGGSCAFGPAGVGTQGGAALQTGPCADGFVRVADARYEARDVQHLLGLLADQGISLPTRNGATGFSYGGGISGILGALNDRVMCDGVDRGDLCDGAADGALVPWTSPTGTPMAMGAIYGQWMWTDLIGSVLVNGRFLDFDDSTIDDSLEPIGVYLKSYIDALLLLAESRGYVQTPGGDVEWDLRAIVAALNAGEPYDPFVSQLADAYLSRHGALGIGGTPAPMLMQAGFTDDLFPAREPLKVYNDLRRRLPDPDVVLLFGDYGHSRSANKETAAVAFNAVANAFFDSRLKGEGDGPPPGGVIVYEMTCPATGPGAPQDAGPHTAPSWAELAPGRVVFGDPAAQTVLNPGGDPSVGASFDPIPQTSPLLATFDPCKQVPAPQPPPGTVATYDLPVTESFTMAGLPTIRAQVVTQGLFGQLHGRLFEVDADGNHRLITRGAYRLEDNQTGAVVFQLLGNAYTFQPGTTVRLEVAPSDAPTYRQPDRPFQVTITDLTVALPVLPSPGGGVAPGQAVSAPTGQPAGADGTAGGSAADATGAATTGGGTADAQAGQASTSTRTPMPATGGAGALLGLLGIGVGGAGLACARRRQPGGGAGPDVGETR